MFTLANCKSSYFFCNNIMQKRYCAIFAFEMSYVCRDDPSVRSLEIVVFEVRRQVEIRARSDGVFDHRSSGSGAQRYA